MHRLLIAFMVVSFIYGQISMAQEESRSIYSATFDMQVPPASVADSPGPLSLVYNPADVSWDDSFQALYLHQENLDGAGGEGSMDIFSAGRGSADGLMLKFPSWGLGMQWIRFGEENSRADYLKYTLAMPLLREGRWFSLGWAVEVLDPTRTNEGMSVDFMTGVVIRPYRYLSFGAAGRNLGRAKLAGFQSHRIMDLAVALRPWFPDPERITLAADLRLVEDAPDPQLRFSASASLVDGLSLFGNLDLDGNFGIGLGVNLLRMGLGGFVNTTRHNDSTRFADLVLTASVSSDNRPGFIIQTGKTAEIVIDDGLVLDHSTSWSLFGTMLSLHDVIAAVHRASRDERVDSLLIRLRNHELRWTDVQELREAVFAFQKTGKKVYFHLEQADNTSYYLAVMGDGVFLAPEAIFAVVGPVVDALFLGGTLDLVGAKVEYQRVGKYKLAPEQLTQRKPSEAKLELMNSLSDQYSKELLSAISAGRKKDLSQVEALIDQGLMHAEDAKKAGLIDDVVDFDEIEKPVGRLLNHPMYSIRNYARQSWHRNRWGNLPVVVVLHASGTIGSGGGLTQGMNANLVAGLLEALSKSSQVDAVVLRVDSPGGSGFASDLIWRKVLRLKQKKPVIVSMGPMAASGGYYISCGADAILANPATITGSIGVFSTFVDLSNLYEKLQIGHAVVKRGKIADFSSTFRGRTEEEKALIQKYVETFYQQFIGKVAKGRGMKVEEIDKIGQGRVWTGSQAKQRGLVDELGGLYAAVMLAKSKIGLEPQEDALVVHLPRPKLSLAGLLRDLGLDTQSENHLLSRSLLHVEKILELVSLSTDPALAMLPFIFTVH